MKEYNVREALKDLVEINFSELEETPVKVITANGAAVRPFKMKDLQDVNKEILVQICDMLGMSDLYLEFQEAG